MFLEKYYDPGLYLNLTHVLEIEWVDENHIKFLMVNGQEIVWEYDIMDNAGDDLGIIRNTLLKKGELISKEDKDGDRDPRDLIL